ncbi:sensor histidine kinase [Sphingomonas sp. BK235]|uniref:sensor histidine kinase n=1 Tax=Sphingomonas sp. BK235 TaxID=2512131 RepID=UPI001048BE6E|nr:sensor histidine kinase [Sphingomonas sp. BK235]TCP36043.1 two-component sensor histidine kinase [Sphingomonas sp. BK235]
MSEPQVAAEMNHRIANNLALLATLMELDGRDVRDPVAVGVLEAARRRVHAIAGVHRRLHLSDRTDLIDLGIFLEELAPDLRGVCQSVGRERRLLLRTQKVAMTAEEAVAVGILVAELVSNACKHAYASDEGGDVRIVQSAASDGSWQLVVEDDGKGIGAFDESGAGLGSRLVAATATRLGASYRWEQLAPGTRFVLDRAAPLVLR